MRSIVRRHAAVPVILLALFGAACSSNDSGTSSGDTSTMPTDGDVNSVEEDFSIALDSSSATAGGLSFSIHNDGPSTHEFVVFKTDLAPDALPTASDGTVDEEGKGVEHVDEVEDITAGSTQSLSVNLDAGSYVVICNLPGHYGQGMHAALTVS